MARCCIKIKPKTFAEAEQLFRIRKKSVTGLFNLGFIIVVGIILIVIYTKPSGYYSSTDLAAIIVLPLLGFVAIMFCIDYYVKVDTKKILKRIQNSQNNGSSSAPIPNIPTFGWNFSTPVVTPHQHSITNHNNLGNTQNFIVPSSLPYVLPSSQGTFNNNSTGPLQNPRELQYPPQNTTEARIPSELPYPLLNSSGISYPTPYTSQNTTGLSYATGISPYPPPGPPYPIGSFPENIERTPYPVETNDPPPSYSIATHQYNKEMQSFPSDKQ